MMEAFAGIRRVHETLMCLRQARTLPLPDPMRQMLEGVENGLQPAAGWTLHDLRIGRIAAAIGEARRFLEALRPFAISAHSGRAVVAV